MGEEGEEAGTAWGTSATAGTAGSASTSLSEALRVLEVQEKAAAAAANPTEKAIIHQMCKVPSQTADWNCGCAILGAIAGGVENAGREGGQAKLLR